MRTNKLFSVSLLVLCGLIFLSANSYSDPLDNWHWRNPVPTGNVLTAITCGNGIFVAVGGAGAIVTSPDGVAWTTRTSGVTSDLFGVTYGSGTFVVVGDNGTILTSTDGVVWTERTSGVTSNLRGVSYGNGTFVAGGYGFSDLIPESPIPCCGVILASSDGVTWTKRTAEELPFLTNDLFVVITYGNSTFVALGIERTILVGSYKGTIFTSSDGVTWTQRASGVTFEPRAVAYGNGAFVAVGYDFSKNSGVILTSSDGVSWTQRASGVSCELRAVAYGNGTFLAVGYDYSKQSDVILTSPDGVTWTQRDAGLSSNLFGVTYANSTFVAVGTYGAILTSTDGVTWIKRTPEATTSADLNAITYGNGTFVAVGYPGIILTSPDGVTWTQRDAGLSTYFLGVTYGNGVFVVVGGDCIEYSRDLSPCGIILSSPDGISWTKRSEGTYPSLSEVTYGNGTFVAVGYGDISATSPDGVTWEKGTPIPDTSFDALAYGNGQFVALGYGPVGAGNNRFGYMILTSPEGRTWTKTPSEVIDNYCSMLTYGNSTFVTVGHYGTIVTSPDGVNWTQRTSGVMLDLYAVTYSNGTFVAVGEIGTILTSSDGTNWTKRFSGGRDYLHGVTYGAGTFVAVGEIGTIIQSDPFGTSSETVSTPNTPNGPTSAAAGESYIYSTGGSSSNLGHPLDYRFDWGDGTYSSWVLASAAKAWTSIGTYLVKAQARCAIDTSVVSSWSSGLTVNTTALIVLQSPSNGTHLTSCSLYSLPTFSWSMGDVFRSFELQFSSDQNFSSIPVKVKASGTAMQLMMNSNIWRTVLSIPGAPGGTVYWRVIGTRADRTTATSDVRSIIIEYAQPVTNSTISPASKSSSPQLSWNNNCNTKFKVWFGSDNNFTKKTTYTFNLKNPNDNGGVFVKTLTSGQWTAITNLVRNAIDPTIYWYVESWDGLGRHNQTGVMSFVFTD